MEIPVEFDSSSMRFSGHSCTKPFNRQFRLVFTAFQNLLAGEYLALPRHSAPPRTAPPRWLQADQWIVTSKPPSVGQIRSHHDVAVERAMQVINLASPSGSPAPAEAVWQICYMREISLTRKSQSRLSLPSTTTTTGSAKYSYRLRPVLQRSTPVMRRIVLVRYRHHSGPPPPFQRPVPATLCAEDRDNDAYSVLCEWLLASPQ